jgi:O-acetyl-ADP-ribose deacetylase (regulator of RNase III)
MKFLTGDILESKCEFIVNPCNCIGVSGGGLSHAIVSRYPEIEKEYIEACKSGEIGIGKSYIIFTKFKPNNGINRGVIFIPTKFHYQDPSTFEMVGKGLIELRRIILNDRYLTEGDTNRHGVGVSAMGCGLGGLSWLAVKPMMKFYLWDLDKVYCYNPKL